MPNKENQNYTFYDYLSFFWRKKWLLLIPPSVLVVIALAYTLTGKPTYLGQATVYTGSIEKETLIQPDLIKDILSEELVDEKKYSIKKDEKRIYFSVENSNKEMISDSLKKISDSYYKELNGLYMDKLQSKEAEVEHLNKYIDELDTSIKNYKNVLESSTLDALTESKFFELLRGSENNKSEYLTKLSELKDELIILDGPRELGIAVNPSKNYLKSNILVAIVIGTFLSLVIFTFWKYIEDARRVRKKVI